VGKLITTLPAGFKAHKGIKRVYEPRIESIESEQVSLKSIYFVLCFMTLTLHAELDSALCYKVMNPMRSFSSCSLYESSDSTSQKCLELLQ